MAEQTHGLSDGRKIGYEIYGDRKGFPLFLLHGTPGSRVWFLEDDQTAKNLGIKLIAADRPGYGLSDKMPGRSILDYANDLKELAEFLGHSTFSVLGVSGGGAYAAGAAYKFPERVTQCILLSSAAPFPEEKPPKSMSKENRLAFFLAKRLPWLIKLANRSQKKMIDEKPDVFKKQLKKGGSHLADWDNQILLHDDVLDQTVEHLKEAYRQGVDEVIQESVLLAKDWGFPLEEISVPVTIWHGEEDTLSPVDQVRLMERKIGSADARYIPEAGHFLSENDHIWELILRDVAWKAELRSSIL
ncbi:alpha/beta fold hydrolase [Metabacillus sp. JX24]|uniref:alpha/beta fold hydrolase n=1 Tax=Metabacillus sp. JX24 TaxID=3240759 RepID=UPI00350F1AFB